LDHLMAELVMANGGNVTNATEFPVFQSVQSYNDRAGGKVAGASQQAIDLIDEAKPYKGGNDGLWLVHKLDLTDKHRSLIPAYGSYRAFVIDPVKWLRATAVDIGIPDDLSMPLAIRPAVRCPLEDGQPMFRVPRDQLDKGHDDDPHFQI